MPIYTELFAKERFTENDMWIKDNLLYEVIAGSHAYDVQNTNSDFDIVALVMNPHMHLYPTQYGYVPGFDDIPSFKHKECKGKNNRIVLPNGKEAEAEWRSLVDFFYLAAKKGSPNLIEILFVKRNLVTFGSKIAWILRDNRKKFLSMKCYDSFKGYAYSQYHRMKNERERGKAETEERQMFLDTYGYDLKKGYAVLRLFDQLHQILTVEDIDLTKNREECKAMRRGEWGDWERFEKVVHDKLDMLEKLASNCSLTMKPRTDELHSLLLNCVEEYYGSDSNAQNQGTDYVSVKMLWERLDTFEENVLRKLDNYNS